MSNGRVPWQYQNNIGCCQYILEKRIAYPAVVILTAVKGQKVYVNCFYVVRLNVMFRILVNRPNDEKANSLYSIHLTKLIVFS